ncbi:pilus assembly protein PilM [Candidatus Woesebacteria bacterium]|nr:pilus assembly protein PilM [Candidatus Woesebacteria bacterium]
MSNNYFCLDLGEKYVRVVESEDKKKTLKLNSAGLSEIPFNIYNVSSPEFDSKASELIRKLVADAKITKTDVRITIPDTQSYTRIFEMPLLTDKELISAIRYQADQFIPIPIDKVSLDLHIISKNKEANKSFILLVAAPQSVIDHVVKITEDAGLIPTNIQNEASSLLSLFSRMHDVQKDPTGATLFVNFGNNSTSLYLYDNVQNLPLQVHNFNIGQFIFYKDIQANFTLSADQVKDMIERIGLTDQQTEYDMGTILASPLNEFTSEIQRFILSSREKSNIDVKQVFMVGEGSRFAGLDKKLAAVVSIPVSLLDLTPYFEKTVASDFFAHDWPMLATGVGANLSS